MCPHNWTRGVWGTSTGAKSKDQRRWNQGKTFGRESFWGPNVWLGTHLGHLELMVTPSARHSQRSPICSEWEAVRVQPQGVRSPAARWRSFWSCLGLHIVRYSNPCPQCQSRGARTATGTPFRHQEQEASQPEGVWQKRRRRIPLGNCPDIPKWTPEITGNGKQMWKGTGTKSVDIALLIFYICMLNNNRNLISRLQDLGANCTGVYKCQSSEAIFGQQKWHTSADVMFFFFNFPDLIHWSGQYIYYSIKPHAVLPCVWTSWAWVKLESARSGNGATWHVHGFSTLLRLKLPLNTQKGPTPTGVKNHMIDTLRLALQQTS